ncbi:MAG: glycosyltransferase family 4 protein [Candidatus Erginobacter occultus]|nr:glycosyltransferase family 4 protein [Candidatus Erginobacter occultus]
MKVLVAIFEELYPLSGGGSPRISNIIRAFGRQGHEVIVAGGISGSDEEAMEYLGCSQLVRLKAVSRLDPAKMKKYLIAHPINIFCLIRAIRRYRPDLVVAHNTIVGYGALWGRRLSRKKPRLVLNLTDVLFEYLDDYSSGGWLSLVQKFGRKMERAAIKGADRIITISRAMKEIVAGYGAAPERIGIVCDGVDLSIFKQYDSRDLREKFAPGKETILVFQGVIDPQDGPELLVAAAQSILKRHPATAVWIIGDGTAVPPLKRMVRETGLSDAFYFSGWLSQAEVARRMSAGDIGLVILPDIVSARGRVTLKEFEYWACGLSVIAPRLPALEEVIEEGKTGLFYRPGDADDLAAKVETLIADPARSRELAAAGAALVEESYRWQDLADQFVELSQSENPVKSPAVAK